MVKRKHRDVPMMNLSIGGRYCSIITVDRGNALVLERMIANTATAFQSSISRSCDTMRVQARVTVDPR